MEKIFLIVPVLYLILEAIRGFYKGLLLSVLSLASWIISIVGSVLLVVEFVTKSGKLPDAARLVSGLVGQDKAGIVVIGTLFLLLALFIKIFCLIIMHLVKKVNDIPVVGIVNRILGGIFGVLKGFIVMALAAFGYAIYSGVYLDVIYSYFPQLEMIVNRLIDMAVQIWSMVGL